MLSNCREENRLSLHAFSDIHHCCTQSLEPGAPLLSPRLSFPTWSGIFRNAPTALSTLTPCGLPQGAAALVQGGFGI